MRHSLEAILAIDLKKQLYTADSLDVSFGLLVGKQRYTETNKNTNPHENKYISFMRQSGKAINDVFHQERLLPLASVGLASFCSPLILRDPNAFFLTYCFVFLSF